MIVFNSFESSKYKKICNRKDHESQILLYVELEKFIVPFLTDQLLLQFNFFFLNDNKKDKYEILKSKKKNINYFLSLFECKIKFFIFENFQYFREAQNQYNYK